MFSQYPHGVYADYTDADSACKPRIGMHASIDRKRKRRSEKEPIDASNAPGPDRKAG